MGTNYEAALAIMDTIESKIAESRMEGNKILTDSLKEYSETKDEHILSEGLKKIININDSVTNDILNMGEIAVAQLREILKDADKCIKEHQETIDKYSIELRKLEEEFGKDSREYMDLFDIIDALNSNLEGLKEDKQNIIEKINNLETMMDNL